MTKTAKIKSSGRYIVGINPFSRWKLVGIAAAALASATPFFAGAAERPDSQGREFWLGFSENESTSELSLFISGSSATIGTVEIPGLAFATSFSVVPGAVTTVSLPANARAVGSGSVQNVGIHVTAGAEVSVYGLNRQPFTTDAYLGLPVDVAGTDTRVLGYRELQGSNLRSQYLVVATRNGTQVTTEAVGDCAATNITLDAGQAYQVSCAEVSGTRVSASAPVSVFAGARCTNVPASASFCDHLVEQMPPASALGERFLTVPLATRSGGDTFRILASEDGTEIRINDNLVATLAAGQFHEQVIVSASRIDANAPVLVAQYSNGSTFDGVTSDPFQMLVPPFEQYLNSYTVTTPASGFAQNFINVVVPTAELSTFRLDGNPVDLAQFSPIAGSSFSGAQLQVGLGSHTLSARLPFGSFVYGFDSFDSYGYPGGLSLSPIAVVSALSLSPANATPKVTTEHCLTAAVSDQNNAPLEGIRVDIAVVGLNPRTGFAQTSANGNALYCYTGTSIGLDKVTATVGNLSANAQVDWQALIRPTTLQVVSNTVVRLGPPLSLSVKVTPKALLKAQNPTEPLAGRTVSFRTTGGSLLNGGQPVQLCTAVTDASGLATCDRVILARELLGLLTTDLGLRVTAAFAGDAGFEPSTDSGIRTLLLAP